MIDANDLGLHRDATSQSVLCQNGRQNVAPDSDEEDQEGWGSWLYNSIVGKRCRPCEKVGKQVPVVISKCGKLLNLSVAASNNDILMNNQILHQTALQMLQWAETQPSPLILKSQMK